MRSRYPHPQPFSQGRREIFAPLSEGRREISAQASGFAPSGGTAGFAYHFAFGTIFASAGSPR